MKTQSQEVYASWARQLELRGLSQPAGFLLQVFSPASYLFFQFYLVGQPWLKSFMQADRQQALADLLDDESNYQAFTQLLLHPEDQFRG
jgi:hypothetical protein